jgi:hypothetical protein
LNDNQNLDDNQVVHNDNLDEIIQDVRPDFVEIPNFFKIYVMNPTFHYSLIVRNL